MTALDGGPHGTTETGAAYVEAALHTTPGKIHRALAKYLTDDAPELISALISYEYNYPAGGSRQIVYNARIHVYEPDFAAWLEHVGLTRDDVTTEDRDDEHNTESVTRGDCITIFTIVAKPAEGRAA